ncbi:MAG: hypothetical protein MJ185_04650 [Treponema sp.]|nr:hypothetical protein [Treponema sp.]
MKKDDYLAVLQEKLVSMPEDEALEKIRYYSDYFDSFGDDEKASLALGNPEDLAKSILSASAEYEAAVRNADVPSENDTEKLYWEFSPSSVKSLSFHLGALKTVIIQGRNFSVETRGLSQNEIRCFLDKSGTLNIINSKVIPGLSFFSHSHDRKRRFYPRVLITVPEHAEIYSFSVGLGAGTLKSRKIDLKYQKGDFQVLAGNLELSRLLGEKTSVRCAFGRVLLDGRFPLNTDIDNFLGKVTVNAGTKQENCSLASHAVLGKVGWNKEKVEIIGSRNIDGTGGNRFSVNSLFSHTNIFFS